MSEKEISRSDKYSAFIFATKMDSQDKEPKLFDPFLDFDENTRRGVESWLKFGDENAVIISAFWAGIYNWDQDKLFMGRPKRIGETSGKALKKCVYKEEIDEVLRGSEKLFLEGVKERNKEYSRKYKFSPVNFAKKY